MVDDHHTHETCAILEATVGQNPHTRIMTGPLEEASVLMRHLQVVGTTGATRASLMLLAGMRDPETSIEIVLRIGTDRQRGLTRENEAHTDAPTGDLHHASTTMRLLHGLHLLPR